MFVLTVVQRGCSVRHIGLMIAYQSKESQRFPISSPALYIETKALFPTVFAHISIVTDWRTRKNQLPIIAAIAILIGRNVANLGCGRCGCHLEFKSLSGPEQLKWRLVYYYAVNCLAYRYGETHVSGFTQCETATRQRRTFRSAITDAAGTR